MMIMFTNNANQVSPSGGAKKGTTQTLLQSSMTSEDIDKVMDLKLSASVEKEILKQERGRKVDMVPRHIHDCSNNPMQATTERGDQKVERNDCKRQKTVHESKCVA
jgi:hypothetical protein